MADPPAHGSFPGSSQDPPSVPQELLTPEELKELLSPLRGPAGTSGRPLLLLTDRPDDVETIAGFVSPLEIGLVPVRNRYAALDLFRKSDYVGFISDASAWGSVPEEFLARIREIDSEAPLGFICDPGVQPPVPVGLNVERPLDVATLRRLFAFLDLPEMEEPGEPAVRVESDGREAPGAPGTSTVPPAEARPDAWLAVRALLEARLEGGGLGEALRRWLELDPAVLGMVTLEPGSGTELRMSAVALADEDRRQVLADASLLFGALPEQAGEPFSHAGFTVFPDPSHPGRWFALRHRLEVPDLAPRFAPILALLARVPTPGAAAAGDPLSSTGSRSWRETLLRKLSDRLGQAAERDRRVGILIVQPPPGAQEHVLRGVRRLLRDDDDVFEGDGQVFGLLSEPQRGVFVSLARRLRSGVDSLRMVGVSRPALGGDPDGLLERAEQILREHPEAPFFEFHES